MKLLNNQSLLIKSDGSKTIIEPEENNSFTCSELQNYVEGYIQLIPLNDNLIVVINEEGKLLNLPYNEVATDLCREILFNNDYIVGNVVIINSCQIK